MSLDFQEDLSHSLQVLKNKGVILYPTDTVWGIGGDAFSLDVIDRINSIKNRENKNLIILVADLVELQEYIPHLPDTLKEYLNHVQKPTTVIYSNPVKLPQELLANDGSIAIRICEEPFCQALLKAFKKPILSTSANISGTPTPINFSEVDKKIKKKVDYIVKWRQTETTPSKPSDIVKIDLNGNITPIR